MLSVSSERAELSGDFARGCGPMAQLVLVPRLKLGTCKCVFGTDEEDRVVSEAMIACGHARRNADAAIKRPATGRKDAIIMRQRHAADEAGRSESEWHGIKLIEEERVVCRVADFPREGFGFGFARVGVPRAVDPGRTGQRVNLEPRIVR